MFISAPHLSFSGDGEGKSAKVKRGPALSRNLLPGFQDALGLGLGDDLADQIRPSQGLADQALAGHVQHVTLGTDADEGGDRAHQEGVPLELGGRHLDQLQFSTPGNSG